MVTGISVEPRLGSGGNISVTTAAVGVNFSVFAPQVACQVTIANNTGTAVEVQQDGVGVAYPVFSGTYFTFYSLHNVSQLGVRRIDQSGSQVTVNARWEA